MFYGLNKILHKNFVTIWLYYISRINHQKCIFLFKIDFNSTKYYEKWFLFFSQITGYGRITYHYLSDNVF